MAYTRHHRAWQDKPGSYDSLHQSRLWESQNAYGLPELRHSPLSSLPRYLVAYKDRIRDRRFDPSEAAVHFFLDDYRFEVVWQRPQKALYQFQKRLA